MKARVIETGEIVEVLPYAEEDGAVRFYANMKNKWYEAYEIDIVSEVTPPDYWTRLEHQYAGMAMQGLILTASKHMGTDQEVAQWAKEYAHALVEKYKKEEK